MLFYSTIAPIIIRVRPLVVAMLKAFRTLYQTHQCISALFYYSQAHNSEKNVEWDESQVVSRCDICLIY